MVWKLHRLSGGVRLKPTALMRVGHHNVPALRGAVRSVSLRRPEPPVGCNVGAENSVDFVLSGLGASSTWNAREPCVERRVGNRKPLENQSAQPAQFPCSLLARATLVLDDPIETEQSDRGGVRVDFDLKTPVLPRLD